MDTTTLITRLEELDGRLNGDDEPNLIHIVNALLCVVSDLCYGLKEEATDDYEFESLATKTNPFFGGVRWALTSKAGRGMSTLRTSNRNLHKETKQDECTR